MYKSKSACSPHKRRVFCLLLGVFLLVFGPLLACLPPKQPEARPSPLPSTLLPTVAPSPAKVTATLLPSPAPTIQPCAPAKLQTDSIQTDLLDKPMDYHVILPPCYAESPHQRYPSLYLLHGQNFDEDQWLRLGVAETAQRLMQAGEIVPFIIILPFDHSFKQPRDYNFEEVFLSLLLPRIDAEYRTLTRPQARAIGGLSRGGAWAIYLASRHPDLFGIVGAHSPVVFYSNTSALPIRLRDIPVEQKPVFYIDAGNNDVDFRDVQQFTELLNGLDVPHEWHYNQGFHNEAYWSRHVEEYLSWYSSQFTP